MVPVYWGWERQQLSMNQPDFSPGKTAVCPLGSLPAVCQVMTALLFPWHGVRRWHWPAVASLLQDFDCQTAF
jgi:hypothetical protein